ncbi:hypothetical protein GUITHDRAFT_111845 [Guillardia theta CCMP2712]|uniref:Uncharacterized protein n=1 Tax=Guillardia theta (strain CCMP2712) TaxID=905079 RepID=L1J1M8_GUITC|nr:hypothetical protein GUITHDRAFT_111845 [Guillardia theta CCMP2712]EKX41990.1 hypothetical protein GUITHDRAFT_111845 [Guillardia theta CCMP2712]|eukprot:XP_005828970.1 hypothetical protein GUITHDRAFT_111845 [Guillardia theta CCMP2712]
MTEPSNFEKISGATASGGMIGLMVGTVNAILGERQAGTGKIAISPKMLSNMVTSTVTVAAVGGVYTATAAASESVRGKDDLLNHVIGACAASGVVGARFGSVRMAMIACPLFAFSTAVVGLCNNGSLFPPRNVVATKHPLHLHQYDVDNSAAH